LSQVATWFTRAVTSARLRRWQQRWQAWLHPHELHYFHEQGDPYSALTASVLPGLRAHYAVDLHEHRVPPPPAALAPDRERLRAWALRDAEHWRQVTGCLPEPLVPEAANVSPTPDELRGEKERAKRGGFLGASFWFRGEWFWGLDRLPLLLRRLEAAGLARGEPWRSYPQRPASQAVPLTDSLADAPTGSQADSLTTSPTTSPTMATPPRPVVEFWCSLRSPYTYLALPRLRAWAEAGLVEVHLRPVLPMVMRGLQVPLVKRLYIVRDAKREADELGLPFGNIADPIGKPTERGLAVLHRVLVQQGTLPALAFAESFLRGVFAEGIDAGTDVGLATIASRVGVDETTVVAALADDNWRNEAAAHREALLAAGLWGVPSFRVTGYPAQWGQDRLWVVEQQWRSKR